MTPYQYVSNNPIMKVDPTGMEDHDYRLKKDGKLELIRETDDSTHTIYNEYNTQSFTFNADEVTGNDGKSLSNFMFSEMETLFSSGFQVYQFTNPDTAEGFYRYAANFSDVEFGKFDGYFGSNYSGFVFTENKHMQVKNGGLARRLSSLDYEGLRFSHSHPNGTQHPSGYYGTKSMEWLYLEPNYRYTKGDRANSKFINSLPGFENTVHEVYSLVHRTFTQYYGDNKASKPSKRSFFDSH